MNDMLMGILRVRNLCSPPYVYTHPFTMSHTVSEKDQFIVLGSDGLFDFFSNDEVVQLVHLFIQHNPSGDPAKHLVEQLILKAADNAGISYSFFLFNLMCMPHDLGFFFSSLVSIYFLFLGIPHPMDYMSNLCVYAHACSHFAG